ncbi:MAG: hypothetical protein AAGE52_00915 [Myxococcota bacterium]
MGRFLCDMENNGLIVVGRVVETEFKNVDEIRNAARAIDEWARSNKSTAAFVYCGTTINWPDEFEFTPSLIGLVTHAHYGDDEAVAEPVPASAFAPQTTPAALWKLVTEDLGLSVSGEDHTYLAIAGWTWTEINGADGERIVGVSGEDDCFTRIDTEERVMSGNEALTMRSSYC